MKNLILIILTICLAEFTRAQTVQSFEFNADNWILPEGSQVLEFQGKQSLMLERTADDSLKGYYATVKTFDFMDGIIEFDMFNPQLDSTYAGFLFRLSNYSEEDRYELFYFDPSLSNDTGAVQYMPVNNNVINWPDFDHDVYKSKGYIPWNEWMHVKAEIEGCTASVYVNDEMVMTVPNLARGRTVGKVGLWLGNSPGCYFSDFSMTLDSIISGISLDGKKVYASSVECDQTLPGYILDGDITTRWASEWADPQWIMIDLGEIQKVGGVILRWEGAYAKAYEIRVSQDSVDWTTVFSTTSSNGNKDEITFEQVDARYVMMHGTTRATEYGYSIWEFEVYDNLEIPSSDRDITATENAVMVYPNPVSDIIHIETLYSVDHIGLFNISGNKIREYHINHSDSTIQIHVDDLVEGIYFVRIHTNNKVITRKLIIQ